MPDTCGTLPNWQQQLAKDCTASEYEAVLSHVNNEKGKAMVFTQKQVEKIKSKYVRQYGAAYWDRMAEARNYERSDRARDKRILDPALCDYLSRQPQCFDDPFTWILWCVQAALTGVRLEEYCKDCTPKYMVKMSAENKCQFPHTVFIWHIQKKGEDVLASHIGVNEQSYDAKGQGRIKTAINNARARRLCVEYGMDANEVLQAYLDEHGVELAE